MATALQILVPFPFVAALLLWRGWRPVPHTFLQRWCKRFAVPLDDTTVAFVATRIGRARRIRTTAAAATIVVPGIPLYLSAVGADDPARWNRGWLVLPFTIGVPLAVVAAEAFVRQRPVGRAVTLERRAVRHYLEPHAMVAVGASAVLTLLVGVVGIRRGLDRHDVVAIACAVLAAGVFAFGLRRIVLRPVLAPEGPQRLADDGLRADGAHHLAGAAVFLAVNALGQAVIGAAGTTSTWIWIPNLLAWVALGYWWALVRDSRWDARVARRRLQHVA